MIQKVLVNFMWAVLYLSKHYIFLLLLFILIYCFDELLVIFFGVLVNLLEMDLVRNFHNISKVTKK